MRLHRLLGIIMLIDSRGIMKAGNLAKILETSERTIYRDIDILCEAGLPIVSIPGPNGGYSFMENYKINSSNLGRGDVFNLLLSSMGIRPEKNTETAQQFKNAIIKLENSVSKEHRDEIIKAKERFFIDSDPWWGKKEENRYIDIIKKSVLDLKKIRISYKKHTSEASQRTIRPYGVVVKNSQWYLAAFCEDKKDIRVFKCSRIEEIEVLDEDFKMPKNFLLEEFWEKSKQQFKEKASVRVNLPTYPARLRFYGKNMKLLEGFEICSFEAADSCEIYEIDMISFETACSIIFPLSDMIEVVEPLELKEYIVKKAENILSLYNNS